jgi:hypothetical protein
MSRVEYWNDAHAPAPSLDKQNVVVRRAQGCGCFAQRR